MTVHSEGYYQRPVRNNKLQVLHLRNTITDGGAERMLMTWFRHCDTSQLQFSLACFANPGNLEGCLVDPIHAMGAPTFRIPWGRRKRLFSAVGQLVKILRAQGTSVIHSHDAKADVVAWLAHLRTGIPVVGSAYAWFGTHSAKRIYLYEWLDAHLLNRFAAVIAISRSLVEESVTRGIDRRRLTIVPSGVDFHGLQCSPDKAAVRRQLGLGSSDFVIGNLARLWPEKGQSVLLEAMKHVVDHVPTAKLLIIGDGPLEVELKTQADALGIGANVIFAGFPGNLPEILQVLNMQVHSSHYEGIPMAILQGMVAGLPIVATEVGGIQEVLLNGENALLVPPGKPEALAQAVLRLMNDPAFSARLGAAARAFVKSRYSMEATMERLAAVYQSVCSTSGPRPHWSLGPQSMSAHK